MPRTKYNHARSVKCRSTFRRRGFAVSALSPNDPAYRVPQRGVFALPKGVHDRLAASITAMARFFAGAHREK